jgi:hypothetical protein
VSLVAILGSDELGVVGYNPVVHGEAFTTTQPIARFLIRTDTEAGYNVYSALAKDNILEGVTVTVDVEGMKNLVLSNDAGDLNPAKPFYLFTTQPVRGSAFEVYNGEVFAKAWSKLRVDFTWKNTPLDFKKHYIGYDVTFASTVLAEKYQSLYGNFDFVKADEEYAQVAEQFDRWSISDVKGMTENQIQQEKKGPNTPTMVPIVKSDSYFKADVQLLNKEEWYSRGEVSLFSSVSDKGEFSGAFEITGSNLERGKAGPARLVLKQPFLHDMYPRLYAVAISSTVPNTLIPNEPYTPFAEDMTLSYTAEDVVTLTDKNEVQFTDRKVQLFHEHPFGQSEEHAYLHQLYEAASAICYATPTYCKGGELYIGLRNAVPEETVSLLIQLVEGSENPEAKTFLEDPKVKWEILGNNTWYALDSSLMVANETDNFLRSGRVRFIVPTYATSDNTLLPEGLFWVRAKMFKRYDAVCKAIGIHAQAAVAQFENNGNDLSHLATGLPKDSITKLIERVSQVKGVQQPYPTFGGRPEESDTLYYKRISERLRHKNRAVALWDYEHIVLQEFPEVYKAKCLNHTCTKHFTSPGSVTLVVIPDTVSRNVFDIYQPRVSRAVLNRIYDHLKELSSMHITLEVINPNYEEVQVKLGAKFYAGLDETHYRRQLEEDIMKFLSPWAFEQAREITFGVTLHRSVLIHYIEKLDYVDYVEDVQILKEGILQPRNCEPSDPKSILVSAKAHVVSPASKTCKPVTKATEETCQL